VELFAGPKGMETGRQRMVEGPLVEAHQGLQRLVLGGGSHVAVHGQVGETRVELRFGREQVRTRSPARKTHQPSDPLDRGALGGQGVVLKTEPRADFIEELRWLTSCGITPISSASWRPESMDNRHRAKLPENPANII
jgi:hypothetical protein